MFDQSIQKMFDEVNRQSDLYVRESVEKIMRYYRPIVEAYMKTNAPWTDRTGRARAGLTTDFAMLEKEFILLFMYDPTIDYDKYLEYANAGRYAIIDPTMDIFVPRIMRAIQQEIYRMRK